GDLQKIPFDASSRTPIAPHSPDQITFDPENLAPGHTPEVIFRRINEIRDIKERFDYLNQLTQEQTLSLLADSFVDTPDSLLVDETRRMFARNSLNVVIMGAGITGLALANMLKNTFRDKINILVMENRVYQDHYKQPYNRNWLTNVLISTLLGVMDQDITDILSSLGVGGFIGVPVNVLETLMLLSCKKLGVKFLFKNSRQIKWLTSANLDVVFDATGNRFNEVSIDSVPQQKIQHLSASVNFTKDFANGFAQYGIRPGPCQSLDQIGLLAADNLLVPAYNDRPLKMAMIKITGLPASAFENLFPSVEQVNHDNRFYLWRGTLKDEINEALLIVNLTPPEYVVLESALIAPISIPIFMELFSDWAVLDSRFAELLRKIASRVPGDSQVRIEPPFLYEPYMLEYQPAGENIDGIPLIRIGDSVYNGHVKCGNGMGYHIPHLRYIHDALLKGQVLYH
ncbi:MAG: hypothetical protein KDI30_02250, partial [Pseudomonadales bacterium]|nr:hypothetical protein [Pseudomonadales bacterium]